MATAEIDATAQGTTTEETAITESIQPFYMNPVVYRIQQNDNLWNLAKKFYGDARLWPHIYRANIRTNPDSIMAGRQLVIPGLQNSPDNLSANDTALIAEGYYMVYEYYANVDERKAAQYLRGVRFYDPLWMRENEAQISIPAGNANP